MSSPCARPTCAADLAVSFGRETAPFKIDVRKLKNLGLTLSLPVGYQLSPPVVAYRNRERKAQGAKGGGGPTQQIDGTAEP